VFYAAEKTRIRRRVNATERFWYVVVGEGKEVSMMKLSGDSVAVAVDFQLFGGEPKRGFIYGDLYSSLFWGMHLG
jgi:hypothetical protein